MGPEGRHLRGIYFFRVQSPLFHLCLSILSRAAFGHTGFTHSLTGAHLNTSKTKVLTTTALTHRMFLDVGGDMIEMVHGQDAHKYLGKKFPGDLGTRATVDVKHRSHIARMKFNQHRETLLNRHVSLKLRLKFFDSSISPAILFGLTTIPLSAAQLSKLDIVRRRMLRSIVGWVPVVNGDWHDAMSKMIFFFFFPSAPFSRRRSLVDDCFTGQSPGSAISIPAAPDVHEGLGQSQAAAP